MKTGKGLSSGVATPRLMLSIALLSFVTLISGQTEPNAFFSNTNHHGKLDGYVADVPTRPHFGAYASSEVAFAQICWFWDWYAKPKGYGRLVDFFFDKRDTVLNRWDFNLPNVIEELAHNDIRTVFQMNGYDCESNTYYCQYPQTAFSYIKSEIDSGRPVWWGVFNYYHSGRYINHALCAVGYKITPGDTLITIHTGWSDIEEDWTIWTPGCCEYVTTVKPGGGSADNIRVTKPSGRLLFQGLRYRMRWLNNGTGIDHCKIWWAPNRGGSYDSTCWTVLTENAPNTNSYFFRAPCLDTVIRLNLSGLNNANLRLATDGSYEGNRVSSVQCSSNLILVGHCDTDGSTEDVAVSGNYAYLADSSDGILSVTVSDSSLPEIFEKCLVPCDARRIFALGRRLYVADAQCTLRIFEPGGGDSLIQLGKLGVVSDIQGLFVRDTLAYLSATMGGLRIIRVSNPTNPIEIGYYNPGQSYYDVSVSGNYAYIATGRWGLRIIDISNPTNPTEIGFYDSPGVAKGIAVNYDRAYLADGSVGGLRVVDVANPASPQPRGMYDSPGEALNCQVIDNFVYLADGSGGLRVIDAADPDNPVESGYLVPPGPVNAVFAPRQTLVYIAATDNGLLAATFNTSIEQSASAPILTYKLSALNPNPFSQDPTITFQIPSFDLVRLELFDVQGRLITGLVEARLRPGSYRCRLPCRDFAPGIYFLKLSAGRHQIQQKIVLVK